MPEILEWHNGAQSGEAVVRVAQALAEGQLVALPTDTSYVLAAQALVPPGVEKLGEYACGEANPGLVLAVSGAGDALDWVPCMSPLGRRLARRCWPGPVELAWRSAWEAGLASRLPAPVRERLVAQGSLVLRCAAHEAVRHILKFLPAPLLFTPVPGQGEPEATSAESVVRVLGERPALVIDAGPTRYGRPATRVRVEGNSWQIVREGIVAPEHLQPLTGCAIVFVCTGNTCRSPLAEGLCKRLLAERLGCLPEELPGRGFIVQSAGLAAMMGGRAAEEAVEVARELGADLSSHSSQPLTADWVAQADFVIAMTRSHLQMLVEQFPRLGPRPRLLCPEGSDIPDPIGCGRPVYEDCAQQILRHLERLLPEVQPS